MTDNYGKSAFALYQCLSGEALSLVHGVEDDFDEMFRRLDQRYADPIKLTDCVIDQLKKLKPQKREWTKKYQNLSNKVNAFPELMKYLKEERELLDYMDTEVRNNTRSTKTAFHSLEAKEDSQETNMTMKEEEEMKLILNGLEYKEREKVWIAHYPWIKDPHQLPNNFGVAMMKLKGTEKRLRKLGGIRTVPFGDICSPAIAVLAMRQTADKYKDDFPIPANIILKDSYMDDIIHSLDDAEETPETMQDVEFILKQGNFHMKEWIVSGRTQAEEDVDLSGTTSEKVLGVVWNPKEDEISYKIKLNITPKQKTSVPCTVTGTDGSDRELPNDLTKRRVLSKISTIFDPLGLVTPVTLCGKLLLRQIILYTCDKDRKLDWDDPLPKELGENWYKFLQNITRLETLKIPRCIRTTELVNPTLIMFNDASTLAYSACAYARWQVGSGKYIARLLASKSRLAPIKIQTVPRFELASAFLSARLRNTLVEESNIKYNYIYHLTDSEIVLAQIMKDNLNVGTYVANRVSEIRETTSKEEWHWISTEVNIADLMTRPNLQVNIDAGSDWQRGPDFLGLPTTEWPIKAVSLKTEEKTIISISSSLTGEQLKEAETLWIKCVQVPLQDNWQVRFKRLGPFCKDGILYVGSRIATWMKNNYNNEAFILLPTTHKLTDLCIKDVHDRDHGGVESTLCKLQAKFWIPQARKLIKATKSRCVTCRKLEKKVIGQSMGPVPKERLKPSPAFYYSALDLFGPLMIKDTVKGRCRRKVYGIILNCLSTRASYVDLVEGYDADSLITTLRRFIAVRGFPRSMYSDYGSQLKLASKEIGCMNRYHEKLAQFGNEGGLEWNFTKSADAPWENGCTEAMVKLVKRVMMRVIGDTILTFGELQSVMFEIANILNERPIGMKNGSSNVRGSYLCSNDLIFGRASPHVPEGQFVTNVNTKTRQEFINAIVNSFWKKWMMYYFPTLILQQKWHTERRNLKVGDIVLVQDNSALKGTWKLAEVNKIMPSSDGKVRDVGIRYKIQRKNGEYEGQQDMMVHRSVHNVYRPPGYYYWRQCCWNA
ncbi:hypothetical protein Pmani_006604 [Petrolisthes manimaculis]|uniref:Integrase catalytic domain-containing protein n=1 Tax=Petrolisthes manimaculis TaxID=1843537 RepID=A0AAE1QC70_9EUCA|nr:hypothetical protein Pmani_006604 [Petrolisthes manimaculis]